jgi:hypothetical protein
MKNLLNSLARCPLAEAKAARERERERERETSFNVSFITILPASGYSLSLIPSSRVCVCAGCYYLFNIISYSSTSLSESEEKKFNEFPQTIFHNIFPHCQ